MQIDVTSITLKIVPSKTPYNRFTGLLHTIGLYLWLWVNMVVLIRSARSGIRVVNSSDSMHVVSIDATIKPIVKRVPPPAPVAEVLP